MHTNAERILTHAEGTVHEDEAIGAARETSLDLGISPVSPAVGALIALCARMSGAKTIVEIGTGAGVSSLWLLRGMRDDGVLTTIDAEPEHQRAAKLAFRNAAIAPSRTRLINGWAQDVLPRLAEESYDLIFVDSSPVDHPDYVREGVRLLRRGGTIILHNALNGGRATDSTQRDAASVAVREAAKALSDDTELIRVFIPLGEGLLCATKL